MQLMILIKKVLRAFLVMTALMWPSICPAFPQREALDKAPAACFDVGRADSKIKIDGDLSDAGWQAAAVLPLPYEWQPGDNIPAPIETECLVTYDLHNLYVAFRCYDPEPKKVRARLMDRDDTDTLILDDHVSFMVDAFNDERRCFQFRINPLGVQADAIFSELEGYEDFSWDAIWEAAGKLTEWGYAVEAAVPLSQLRFRKTPDRQTWGFSAERSWPRDVRHRMTSHIRSRSSSCILCQFNKLTGFQGIKPSRNIELDPTLTGIRTDAMPPDQFPAGRLEKDRAEIEPGLTAKWGLTPNLILNATLNPDFSQVEADVAQLEVNRRFALFYPEKRPFFLEGADFFLTPLQAVFSRTVIDPLWGAKMTGKLGRTAIGFFATQDRTNNLIFPANQGSDSLSLEQDITGGVFRLRQDIGKMSTLGFLYTGRTGDGYFNHVAGCDGFLRFDQKNTLTFQFLHSETDYPQETAAAYGQKEKCFGGNAFLLQYQYYSRNWIFNTYYQDLGRDFRADYGFVPRVDTRDLAVYVFRLFWGQPEGWFNLIRLGFAAQGTYDHQNRLTDRTLILGALYQGPLNLQANVHGYFLHILYNGRDFDLAHAELALSISPLSGASFGLEAKMGDDVDYSNTRKARVIALGPTAAFSLGAHLNVSLSHAYERLSFEGGKIYTANLTQAEFLYNFNVRTFVRAIIQYSDLDQNPAVYSAPPEPTMRGLFTQFLFSYKINPRTVVFLGYSDNSLGLEQVDMTRLNRTFFLKLAYALQL
jgi:hypothetical protein